MFSSNLLLSIWKNLEILFKEEFASFFLLALLLRWLLLLQFLCAGAADNNSHARVHISCTHSEWNLLHSRGEMLCQKLYLSKIYYDYKYIKTLHFSIVVFVVKYNIMAVFKCCNICNCLIDNQSLCGIVSLCIVVNLLTMFWHLSQLVYSRCTVVVLTCCDMCGSLCTVIVLTCCDMCGSLCELVYSNSVNMMWHVWLLVWSCVH